MSARKLQPLAHGALNRCFGCGQANRTGLRLKFFVDEQQTIVCPVRLARRFEASVQRVWHHALRRTTPVAVDDQQGGST